MIIILDVRNIIDAGVSGPSHGMYASDVLVRTRCMTAAVERVKQSLFS